MIQANIYGRLSRDPQERQTKSGKTMVMCDVAVDATPANSDADETMWINLLAFGRQADVLLRHKKGDLLSFSGKLTQSKWRSDNSQGQERTNFSVLADSIISARSVRPSTGGGRKAANTGNPETTQQFSEAAYACTL